GLFDLVSAEATVSGASDTDVQVEARSSPDLARWSPWTTVPLGGEGISVPAGSYLQYRIDLSAGQGEKPLVEAIRFEVASSGALMVEASADNPTVRLFATREGLTGKKTANGHTVVERDHFVALPSRRVLNSDGGNDYQ